MASIDPYPVNTREMVTSHDVIFTVEATDDVIKSDVIDLTQMGHIWLLEFRKFRTKFYLGTDRDKVLLSN